MAVIKLHLVSVLKLIGWEDDPSSLVPSRHSKMKKQERTEIALTL